MSTRSAGYRSQSPRSPVTRQLNPSLGNEHGSHAGVRLISPLRRHPCQLLERAAQVTERASRPSGRSCHSIRRRSRLAIAPTKRIGRRAANGPNDPGDSRDHHVRLQTSLNASPPEISKNVRYPLKGLRRSSTSAHVLAFISQRRRRRSLHLGKPCQRAPPRSRHITHGRRLLVLARREPHKRLWMRIQGRFHSRQAPPAPSLAQPSSARAALRPMRLDRRRDIRSDARGVVQSVSARGYVDPAQPVSGATGERRPKVHIPRKPIEPQEPEFASIRAMVEANARERDCGARRRTLRPQKPSRHRLRWKEKAAQLCQPLTPQLNACSFAHVVQKTFLFSSP